MFHSLGDSSSTRMKIARYCTHEIVSAARISGVAKIAIANTSSAADAPA
jgi:hypothetical protein